MRVHNDDYKTLINSWRWQKLRRAKLSADPLCEMCKKKGRAVRAEQVHHIVPVESVRTFDAMKALAYDPMNLQSLCKKCHQQVHAADTYKGRVTRRIKNELDLFARRYLQPGTGGFSERGEGAPNSAPPTEEKY